MFGRIFITSTGYDPEHGKHVKDPYLEDTPSLGACRPDIRKNAKVGDHIFVISGKVENHLQFIMGGFEVSEIISAQEAFVRFPEQRLHLLPSGEVAGNVIVDGNGSQHFLDHHSKFEQRLVNYLVGKNPIALLTPEERRKARQESLDVLRRLFEKPGDTPFDIIGRSAKKLEPWQVRYLLRWLDSIKTSTSADEFVA